MRANHTRLISLFSESTCHRPFAFDRVTIAKHGVPVFSVVGPIYSPYEYSPSLWDMADLGASVCGDGGYSIASHRPLGYMPKVA